MENKKYEIKYFPKFVEQFKNILFYMTYELKNKIAAENFYEEVIMQIEKRSEAPESYEIFLITKKEKSKFYKINVRNYSIFYTVRNDVMEIRRICYSRKNFDKLI